VIRPKAQGEGHFAERRGEWEVEKGGVDEEEIDQGV
jgi:hypothetical protein